MQVISQYLQEAWLNTYRNEPFNVPTLYIALIYAGQEIDAPNYGRQELELLVAGGQIYNSSEIAFSPSGPAGWGPIDQIQIYDASSEGNLLFATPVSPVDVGPYRILRIPSRQLSFQFDSEFQLYDWQNYDPITDWANVQEVLLTTISPTPEATIQAHEVPSRDYDHRGTILAPNGCAYMSPYLGDFVMKVDPSNNTIEPIGSEVPSASTKYFGGALGQNGKIYLIPSHVNEIVIVDPDTDTIETIPTPVTGTWKWWGGVAVDKWVFGIPFDQNIFLRIDTETNETDLVGSLPSSEGGAGSYACGVLAPNNFVYMPPRNAARHVLKFNPFNFDTEIIGPQFSTANHKFLACCLAPNGIIYAVPRGEDSVIRIDPEDDSVAKIGPTLSNEYENVNLGGDGRLYALPHSGSEILIIDPEDDSVTLSSLLVPDDIRSSFSSPEGVFGVPYKTGTTLYRLEVGATIPLNTLLLNHFNTGD